MITPVYFSEMAVTEIANYCCGEFNPPRNADELLFELVRAW